MRITVQKLRNLIRETAAVSDKEILHRGDVIVTKNRKFSVVSASKAELDENIAFTAGRSSDAISFQDLEEAQSTYEKAGIEFPTEVGDVFRKFVPHFSEKNGQSYKENQDRQGFF